MSDLSKAYCEDCKKKHNYDVVTAVKYGWCQDWGILKWFLFLVMCIITGFFWLFFVFGWCLASYPRWRCQGCNSILEKKDLRL